jgi:hypothetical protein
MANGQNPASGSFEPPPPSAVRQPEPLDGQEDAVQSFTPPETGAAEEAAATPEARGLVGVDDRLLSVKQAIETQLMQRAQMGGVRAMDAHEGAGNVIGVAIGIPEADLGASGEPGAAGITLFVVHDMGHEDAKSVVVDSMGIQAAASDDVPVHVIETGIIEAQTFTVRMRPSPCGISIGHYKITAGTQGCLATGLHAPRASRLLILSNNHVLANVNAGVYGDCICQPGPYDGGKCPADQVAILERFVPVTFAAGVCNYVDCATGWAWPDRVRKEFIYHVGAGFGFFNIGSVPITPYLGMPVGKTGRTTQLTSGRVTALSATINVNYGQGRVATFCDQIAIQANTGNFSAGGDSGSLIWTWDAARRPVGLLFAGGGTVTFANKIGRVLAALDIRLIT